MIDPHEFAQRQFELAAEFGKFVFLSDKPDLWQKAEAPKNEYRAVPVVEETRWEEPAATN